MNVAIHYPPASSRIQMILIAALLVRARFRAAAAFGCIAGVLVSPCQAAEASCVPTQVAVFINRIHVRCTAAVGGIQYFALGTTDQAFSSRVLTILTTAQVAGRTIGIDFEPSDTTGSSFGCRPADCRIIRGVWFGQ